MEHKLIQGGEQYLPFARSRIKALRATGLKYASQKFEIDGVSISVRLLGEDEYIRLEGGSAKYQFFSTGPAQGYGFYAGYAVLVVGGKGGSEATPLASSLEVSPDFPPAWPFVTDPRLVPAYFPFKNIWQIEGITGYSYYPAGSTKRGVSKKPMVSSWGISDPLCSLGMRSQDKHVEGVNSISDWKYDVAPNRRGKDTWAPTPDADWYRHAAHRLVTNEEHGDRRFVILVDTSNVFHVFPDAAPIDMGLKDASPYNYQDIKTTTAELYCQRQQAPMPTWARNAAGAASRDTYELSVNQRALLKPMYQWSFNSTATKACSLAFEVMPLFRDDPVLGEVREELPGVVEVVIGITITGPELYEFEISITPGRAIRPTVDKVFVHAAEYAWKLPGFAALDDLLTLEGEIYYDTTDEVLADPNRISTLTVDVLTVNGQYDDYVAPYDHRALVVARNRENLTVLRTFVAESIGDRKASDGDAPTLPGQRDEYDHVVNTFSRLLSCDLRSLSFVVQQGVIEYEFTESVQLARMAWWGNYRADHTYDEIDIVSPYTHLGTKPEEFKQTQRLVVYVFNELKETKLIDPDSDINGRLEIEHGYTAAVGAKFPVGSRHPSFYRASDSGFVGNDGDRAKPAAVHRGRFSDQLIDPRQLVLTGITGSAWSYPDWYFGDVSLGAILYGRAFKDFNLCGPWGAVMSVHPDGRWAVTTNPIYYFAGYPKGALQPTLGHRGLYNRSALGPASPASLQPVDDTATQIKQKLNTLHMRQGYLDIIDWGKKDLPRASHREMLNKAFNKNFSVADFSCTFALVEKAAVNNNVASTQYSTTYIEVSRNGVPIVIHPLYTMMNFAPTNWMVGLGHPQFFDISRNRQVRFSQGTPGTSYQTINYLYGEGDPWSLWRSAGSGDITPEPPKPPMTVDKEYADLYIESVGGQPWGKNKAFQPVTVPDATSFLNYPVFTTNGIFQWVGLRVLSRCNDHPVLGGSRHFL